MPKEKKTAYLLFCSNCTLPQSISKYTIRHYFISGNDGVYCRNCRNKTEIPEYLKKIKDYL